MKIRFIHPLWAHLPAFAALVVAVVFTVKAMPLPDPAPIHFSFGGQPDSYGSPWMSTMLLAVISVFYIGLSIAIDEAWARQEKRKSFNWISLFDDVTVALLAAIQINYVNMLASSSQIFRFPWALTVIMIALTAGIAAMLELARPFHHYESSLSAEDVSQVTAEVARIVKTGQPLFYWENQNPVYSRILAIAMPVVMAIVAVTLWSESPWVSVFFALSGVAMTLIYGGFRTLVTRDGVTVKLGLLGIPLLHLKTSDIAAADLHCFSPLKDFGGYGIRFNRQMKAYFLNGSCGVKITTRGGKRYLIGSDHPDRLATVISTVLS